MLELKLKNLDCAACADRIETRLKKLGPVNINLLTSTLKIDFDNLNEIKSAISEVDDQVIIEEIKKSKPSDTEADETVRKEILKIVSVLLLFFSAILLESLHIVRQGDILLILLFISAYLLSGWQVLKKAFKNLFRGKVFDENFLMSLATIGAILINELNEAVAVMLFYNVGEFLQGISVRRSRKSIRDLLEFRPAYVNMIKNSDITQVSPEEVSVGEIFLVKPGEKIPLDGEVIDGESFIDTMPLTGESLPKPVSIGDSVLAGTINKSALLKVKSTKLFSDTSVSKILHLAENSVSKKAETEKFITRFARYYTPLVVVVALLIATIPPLLFPFSQNFSDWIYRALVILVISCPCALVISIPLGYFGGIGAASEKGYLLKVQIILMP